MPTNNVTYVGVDVSMANLVISYTGQDKKRVKATIKNELTAIQEWVQKVIREVKLPHFVLEYTGVYSDRLTHMLALNSVLFSVVNPSQSSAMAKLLNKSVKNDDQDAQLLCDMAAKLELKLYKMPSSNHKNSKEIQSALNSLKKIEGQLKNQIHAFEYRVNPNSAAVEALTNSLDSIQKEIKQLTEELGIQLDDEESQRIKKILTSIKGVGEKTSTAAITQFGNMSQFENVKCFVKFIGLAPSEYTSGKSVKARSKITKKGSSGFRSLLFNCARKAISCNESCKTFYQRMIEKGKNGKQALTAVMHQIARWIFGVVKSGKEFDINFAASKQKVA